MKKVSVYFLLLAFHFSFAQHSADSIKALLKTDKEDTIKVWHLKELAESMRQLNNSDSATKAANTMLALARKIKFSKGEARALNTLGLICNDGANYQKGLAYFIESLKVFESLKDKKAIADCHGNLGTTYDDLGNYPLALEHYLAGLKVFRETNNKYDMAASIGNIGVVYYEEGDAAKALSSYQEAADLDKEINNESGFATNLGNMGLIYYDQHSYPKALEYLTKALKICQQSGNKAGVALHTGNIANIYQALSAYPLALDYNLKALAIYKEIGDKDGITSTMGNIGGVYLKEKKYDEAEKYLKEAVALADTIHDMESIRDFNGNLSSLYADKGQWQKATETFKAYSSAKDSLMNQDKSKQLGKLEAKAEYDKQFVLQQAENNKRTELAAAESKRQRIVIALIGAIALAVACIAMVIFRSLRVARKQKEIIEVQKKEVEVQKEEVVKQKEEVEKQKEIIEEKNKDILDSIAYAKRLQDAILPPLSAIKKYLPESYVLYKPKDIVAGDFYWMERVGDTLFVAAADCTGHGVPGAMVSVVCSNALNRAVKEFHITEPGKILDKTRGLVLETFEKSEGDIKDGMDVSLCSLSSSGDRVTVSWAGAYNPLWYVQNGQLKEIGADKQPVGKQEGERPFTTHHINLNKGDTLYLFTDGYADQFGGPKGKKFKYKQLQELLLSCVAKPVSEQKNILDEAFQTWKGNLEQIDDVLIMCIRV